MNVSDTKTSNYQYVDLQPLKGQNYYQLLVLDQQGKVLKKGAGSVNFDDKDPASVTIYPNPSDGEINLSMKNIPNQTLHIKITTLWGKMLYASDIQKNSDQDNYKIILPSQVSKGTYILNISGRTFAKGIQVIVR